MRWRCADLRVKIADHFLVTFHKRSVGKPLRKLGLTRLQPHPTTQRKMQRYRRRLKNFAILVNDALPAAAIGRPLEIWFQML